MFQFAITTCTSQPRARTGIFQTPHRDLETPELAIVATEGAIRSVPREMWQELPNPYFIVNTYHTYTKGLIPPIEKAGGVHSYMGLEDRTFATDSGGFQVFSLGFGQKHDIGKVAREHVKRDLIQALDVDNPLTITEENVSFLYDGTQVTLSPEKSMDLQHKLGADIMFAFDECTSPLNSKEYIKQSMERTHRWLDRCVVAHKGHEDKQALFGIVQGGEHKDLREESARIVGSADVPGFGIGGSFGDFKEALGTTVGWVNAILPPEKPRHLLGIGKVRDIFAGVENGVDLFDCVIPTREARHRMIYTKTGRHYLRKKKHLDEPMEPGCLCHTCREGVTCNQLWQWFLERDTRAPQYVTIHNVWFFAHLMKEIRESLGKNMFEDLKDMYYKCY